MITAVVDTNVLVSGIISDRPDSPPVQVVNAWRANAFRLATSDHILSEVAETLAEPYFARRLPREQREAYLALLVAEAAIVSIAVSVKGVATHPEDDAVLATVLSAAADYLVTGDRHLQALRIYEGIRVVSPRDFLIVIRGNSPS